MPQTVNAMNRNLMVVSFLLLLLLVAVVAVLKIYSPDLVQHIVVNAVIQKAPADYPAEEIRKAFEQARRSARDGGRQDAYLETLLAISLRLEKTQYLSQREIQELLQEL